MDLETFKNYCQNKGYEEVIDEFTLTEDKNYYDYCAEYLIPSNNGNGSDKKIHFSSYKVNSIRLISDVSEYYKSYVPRQLKSLGYKQFRRTLEDQQKYLRSMGWAHSSSRKALNYYKNCKDCQTKKGRYYPREYEWGAEFLFKKNKTMELKIYKN